MKLNQQDILRYCRHFPLIGVDGQEKLKSSAILCIGAGGLGAPVLQYLTAAGVGTLGIVDSDQVELSNLQRQVLFKMTDVGQSKVRSAESTLKAINPNTHFVIFDEFLTVNNADHIIQSFDIIVDCTDNYQARYLINDVCVALKKPLVSASIHQFQGQCSVFNVSNGPCYRCLYETPPPKELAPNCALAGVLGVLPGLLGSIQASEAIKLALSLGESLSGRLLCIDLLSMTTKEYILEKNPDCPACHDHQLSADLFIEDPSSDPISEITPQQLSDWLNQPTKEIFLLDVREASEHAAYHIEGSQLLPLTQLTEKIETLKIETLPHLSSIVIYCQSGSRSKQAATLLLQHGYTDIYCLKGGITSWIQASK